MSSARTGCALLGTTANCAEPHTGVAHLIARATRTPVWHARMKLALWRASAALTIIKYQSLNELTVERPGAKRMWMCVFGSGEVGRSGPVPYRKFRADIPDRWSGLKSPAARRNPLARIDQCSRQRRA